MDQLCIFAGVTIVGYACWFLGSWLGWKVAQRFKQAPTGQVRRTLESQSG